MVVHTDKLRWLAWLRVKMLLRNFRRRPSTLVFTIIGLLALLFIAGELAFVLDLAFNGLSLPAATEVLYLFFSGMLLFWIVLPLLSYSTNEGLDVTKLQLFPLTRLELMFSLLFSSLFDIWTVLLFVIFGVTIVAWWLHSLVLGLMTLLVILVFYVVMVGISQLILALLMRVLQSRKFRDISVIILALFGSSCYLLQRLAIGTSSVLNLGNTLHTGGFSPVLQWSPAGVAASAIRAAYQQNWSLSFAFLGILLAIGALVLYLWQIVLERSMVASETGAARKKKTEQQAHATQTSTRTMAASRGETASRSTILWEQMLALVKKELTIFWRDPQLKVRLFQIVIYVVAFVLLPAFNNSGSNANNAFLAGYAPLSSVAVVMLFMLTLAQNTLGLERESLTALFLFPIDRRRLLWGKNLAFGLIGVSALIILMVVCVFITHQPEQALILPATVIGLAGMGVTLGWSNMTSVYFPRYQPPMGRKNYAASGGQAQNGGCMNIIMSLAMTLVSIVSLAPVALSIGIPFFMQLQWLWIVTMPLSLIYGVVLYIGLTNLASQRMLATEPEILTVTTRA